ncbi:MAG TPA: BON domain-containing protein [Burkholderiales bacterium]|nr:BON domain-containing protein [Burkholderiales bacterium]
MPRHLVLIFISALSLAACGDEPAPKPAPQPAAPKPAAEAPPAPVAAPAPAPVAKAPEAPKPDPRIDPNKELAERVKQALEGQAKIQAAGIDVTATDGAVTLWGTAATAAERDRAARAAAKVDGVKTVQNKIAVVKGS